MIGKNLQDNLDIKVNSKKMEKLKDDFPEFFTKEGDFKLDSFKDFLKEEEVELTKEAYELDFLGKSYAKYESSLNTETYISPDVEHNEKPENKDSENIYIVGDNIDSLKHLLDSYSGKIKCIYIDPPYNTGSDGFVYPDNFKFTADELAEKICITEEEADRILNLEGKSSHAAWLTFMYPRLLLARDLLADDGVIFISIDDNEQANLKLMCDEIFGEENCLANLVWKKKYTGGKGTSTFADYHEYILTYAKNKNDIGEISMERPESEKEKFILSDEYVLERGKYYTRPLKSNLDPRPTLVYPIELPDGSTVTTQWICAEKTYLQMKEEGRIEFKDSNTSKFPVYKKFYENDGAGKVKIPSFLDVSSNNDGKKELKELFNINQTRDLPFPTPKPTKLLNIFIENFSSSNDIILDFFAGSSSTADAVMQLNAEDGGIRKYILVQLPEPIKKDKPAYKAGYRTVDEIGRDRIEKAAAKIKDETKADIDYGYKLFYLEKPSEKTLLDLEEFKPEIKLVSDDMISVFDNKHASGKENILATWLNEDGYGLTKETRDYKLENYTAQLIEKTLYIIDEGLESDDVMKLIKQIEDDSLDITRLVIYSYSVKFSVLNELRKNIKVLKNNKNVTLIERF